LAWFPKVAVDGEADEFDFRGMADGGVVGGFGPGIAEDTEGNGDDVALLLVADEDEAAFALAEAFMRDGEADGVLFAFEKISGGGGELDEFFRCGIFIGGLLEKFENFSGGKGGGAASDIAAASLGEVIGFFRDFFYGANVVLVVEPALVTGHASSRKVLVADGHAVELGGEDFFDGLKFVEPGEDVRAAFAVVESGIDFLANLAGKAGDFACQSAGDVGFIVLRFFDRAVLN